MTPAAAAATQAAVPAAGPYDPNAYKPAAALASANADSADSAEADRYAIELCEPEPSDGSSRRRAAHALDERSSGPLWFVAAIASPAR